MTSHRFANSSWRACTLGIVMLAGAAVPAFGAQSFDTRPAMQPASNELDQAPAGAPPEKAEPPAPEGQAPVEQVATTTRSFVSALFHNLVDDVKHVPRRNTMYWLAGGVAASAAVHPADNHLNRRLRGASGWNTFFGPGKYIGSTWVLVSASATTYIVGRATGADKARHLGMDLLEAQLLTEGVVQTTKAIGRRPRPRNPDGTENSLKTFAFPSGHAAMTFASATVLQQHLGWKAAVPTYLVASYVAVSRLHDNRHYLSDVVMGASMGVVVGRSVTWHGRNNYSIAAAMAPRYAGMTVQWR